MAHPFEALPLPDPREEEQLLDGCRASDPKALDRFFRCYITRVERVIGRLIGPSPDVEDLVQTTFIETLDSFARFRGEASLATWVTRIAVHVVQHHLRRGVRRTIPLQMLPAAEEPEDAGAHPERDITSREVALRLHVALDRVKPKKRIAFLLYAVEGHTLAEVAALTGSSLTATKSRVWFARRELLALAKRDPVLRDLMDSVDEVGG